MSVADFTVLPFRPDWASPVQFSLGFQNSVMTATNGDEQRTNHRTLPRRAFTLNLANFADGRAAIAETMALEKFLREQIGALVGVPAWWDATPLVGIADDVVTVEEAAHRAFAAAGSFIIWRAYDDYVACDLSEITANDLTAAEAPEWEPADGDIVMPLVVCRLLNPSEIGFESDWHSRLVLAFAEDKACLQAVDFPLTPLTYRGRAVFPFLADWATPPQLSRGIDIATLEAFGRDASWQTESLPREGFSRGVSPTTRQQRAQLLRFFSDRLGRLGSFWLPIPRAELEMYEAALANATQIKIKRVEYAPDLWQPSHRRRVLAIEDNGAFRVRNVTEAILQTGYELLTLSAPLPAATSINARLSFLRCARFDTDDIALTLHSPAYCTAPVRFREVGETEYEDAITADGDPLDAARDSEGMLL